MHGWSPGTVPGPAASTPCAASSSSRAWTRPSSARCSTSAATRPARRGDAGGDGEPVGPDAAAAERLLRKKLPAILREADPRRRRQRAYALLARSGFAPDVCASVSRAVLDDIAAAESLPDTRRSVAREGEAPAGSERFGLTPTTCLRRGPRRPRARPVSTRCLASPIGFSVVGYGLNRTRTVGRAPGEPRHRWGAGGARPGPATFPKPKRMPVVRSPSPNLVSAPGAFIPPGGRN